MSTISDGQFARRCNTSMVALEPMLSSADQQAGVDRAIWHSVGKGRPAECDEVILRRLIESHFRYTGSFQAREILASWPTMRAKFVKVMPLEYRRALGELAAARAVAPALPGGDDKLASESSLANRTARRTSEAGGAAGKLPADRQR